MSRILRGAERTGDETLSHGPGSPPFRAFWECKGCPETFCKGCHETGQRGAFREGWGVVLAVENPRRINIKF
jgi:hypothetical protein